MVTSQCLVTSQCPAPSKIITRSGDKPKCGLKNRGVLVEACVGIDYSIHIQTTNRNVRETLVLYVTYRAGGLAGLALAARETLVLYVTYRVGWLD